MEIIHDPHPTAFELALAEALLAGDLPFLQALRSQWKMARFESRELSGAGFFLNLAIPESAPRAEPLNFTLGDVYFEVEAVPHGGGSVLFVRDGIITMLEAYTHDGAWPDEITDFTLRYVDGDHRNLEAVETSVRSH